ncbi:MAG: glycerophosphodiester phosphodiesterase [Gammaproteobacteria bacterium]|nr:glycerophosphodiester phosphodiesterase [Gammaproteobacteria bacterium]
MKILAAVFLIWLAAGAAAEPSADDPIVIAHRGASGYLPEHTLVAYAMAYAQGADYLEPDLVLSADGHAVALHDLTLEAVSDVRDRFPDRARDDGQFYVVDFTLAELRQLRIHERIEAATGEQRYPSRFSADLGHFQVVTLAELIELTQGLNAVTGRNVGIYPELKFNAFHEAAGHDFVAIVMEVLDRYGYESADARCIIQSFEPAPLMRLREEFATELPLVQLLGENAWGMNDVDYDAMYTPEGLAAIAGYADGIGPPIARILTGVDEDGRPAVTSLVKDAKAVGLDVHPYTLRADSLPEGVDFETLLGLLLQIGIDGIFTDHPDRAVAVVQRLQSEREPASAQKASASP